MNGNELDGMHWVLFVTALIFMAGCMVCATGLFFRTKELAEKEDEIQQLRESAQQSQPL